MANSRQPVKITAALIATIAIVWLSGPGQERNFVNIERASKTDEAEGTANRLPSHYSESILPSLWEIDAATESNVVDRWKDAVVLSSSRSKLSSDQGSYRLRRIVRDESMRFPVFVEEIVMVSPHSGVIEAREVISERAAAHFLLTPKSNVSGNTVEDLVSRLGLRLAERVSLNGPYRIAVPESLVTVGSVQAWVSDLNSGAYSSIVEFADYDFVRRIATVPDDTYYSSGDQWSLDNDGSRSGSVKGVDIGALEGWKVRTDASDVVVAIVDTGARYTHEDLNENIWVNADEIPDNSIDDDGNGYVDDIHGINTLFSPQLSVGGDPMDDHGHGTHVAGTVGARGNNGLGIAGVAWNVQLMPLKFLGSNGNGLDSDAIKCIDYAIRNGADIINNSWGGDGVNRALSDAVERANEAGIIVVVAAGNGGDNIDVDEYTPAGIDLPNVVTVANHDDSGDLQSSSNFGREKVDIAAPGTRIRSATHRSDSSYGYKSGTSMSAPHVSGVLALLRAEYPGESHIKLIERVLQGAVKADPFDEKVRTAARLNLANSFAMTEFFAPSPSKSILSSSSGYAVLEWEHDWMEPIEGFRIEKGIDSGEWEIAGFVGPGERQFKDPIQLISSSVVYRLISVNGKGDSLPSQHRVFNSIVENSSTVDIQLPQGDEDIGYGSDVASNSRVLVVGAPFDDDAGESSGSVYLYERIEGSGWEYRQKLIGADTESYDNFGYSIGLSESLLVVGAYNEDEWGIDAGALYVFEPESSGAWAQTRKIVVPGGEAQEKFGFSVDVFGDLIVSSARDDGDSGRNAGAVHVFEREGENAWIHQVKLTPPLGSDGAYFGWSVSAHGDRIVVGAKGDDSSGVGAGSVYVYRKAGGQWLLEQKIVSEDPSNYDAFGTSVDFDGTSIVVGTPNDDGEEFDTGSISLYRNSGSRWERVRDFVGKNPTGGERLGTDVAVLGNRVAAVGQADEGFGTQGMVFEERVSGEWVDANELFAVEASALKGASITLSDRVVSVGIPSERQLRSFYDLPEATYTLQVDQVSREGVSISWSDPGLGMGSIVIERREVGEDRWSVLSKRASAELSFVDHSSTGGRQWEYRVRGISGGVAGPSNTVTTPQLPVGRLVNISVRGYVGKGEQVLVPGFTVVGAENLSVAIRARGPSLLEHSVPNPIGDPKMTVYPWGRDSIGGNDDWLDRFSIAEMESLQNKTGASSITEYASESVFMDDLATGVYTAVIENSDGTSGLGLAEIYEVPTDGEYDEQAALVNLSARGFVDTGVNVLIGGFVVAGDAPVRVLLRGVGPGLEELGVVNTIDQPRITVYDSTSSSMVSNQNWGIGGQIGEIIELSKTVGAFDLKLGSKDAALIATLPPGLYTCVLDTESDDNGVGLLEIYLAP